MPKIIEAQAVISAKDNTGTAFAAVSKKLGDISKAGKLVGDSMSGMSRQVGLMQDKLSKIQNFRAMHSGLVEARGKFRDAQREVERLGRAVGDAAKPSRDLARAYEQAQRAVRGASAAFKQQAEAVSAAKREMQSAGVPFSRMTQTQERLKRSIDGANASLIRQASMGRALAQRTTSGVPAIAASTAGGGGGGAGAIAGLLPGGLALKVAGNAITNWSNMDEALRRQGAITELPAGDLATLKSQAFKIGQDTRFTNPDVVRAQTTISTRLPKELRQGGTISGITEAARDYALAMGTTMDEGAEAIIARMLARRMDMSTPEAAGASARHAANRLVQRAKMSGAKHDDLMGSTKFGAAPGQVAGFSEEFQDAFEAQLQRIGYEGSMTGNFARAAAMKLATPTTKGLAAIAASGLRYDDYVKPGTNFSSGGLSDMLKQKFGRSLNADQIARVQAIFDDENVVGDRGSFVEGISGVLNESFAGKTKSGKVNAQDAARIAKTADTFYTLNASGVETERLMTDLVKQGLSAAVARYLFGQEHGGRAQSLDAGQLTKDMETMRSTPGDRAAKIGQEINAGFSGALTRLTGSVETLYTRIGEVNDRFGTKAFDAIGNTIDAISNLRDPVLQFGSAAAGAASVLLGIGGAAGAAAHFGVPGAAAVSGAVGGLFGFGGRIAAGAARLAGSPFGAVLGAGALLDAARPTTAANFQARWNPDLDAAVTRSYREQMDVRRDPEGARGRAMARRDWNEKQEIELKGDVKTEVEVKVTADEGLLARIVRKATEADVRASNGPGSVGTTMPEASAPRRGRGDM